MSVPAAAPMEIDIDTAKRKIASAEAKMGEVEEKLSALRQASRELEFKARDPHAVLSEEEQGELNRKRNERDQLVAKRNTLFDQISRLQTTLDGLQQSISERALIPVTPANPTAPSGGFVTNQAGTVVAVPDEDMDKIYYSRTPLSEIDMTNVVKVLSATPVSTRGNAMRVMFPPYSQIGREPLDFLAAVQASPSDFLFLADLASTPVRLFPIGLNTGRQLVLLVPSKGEVITPDALRNLLVGPMRRLRQSFEDDLRRLAQMLLDEAEAAAARERAAQAQSVVIWKEANDVIGNLRQSNTELSAVLEMTRSAGRAILEQLVQVHALLDAMHYQLQVEREATKTERDRANANGLHITEVESKLRRAEADAGHAQQLARDLAAMTLARDEMETRARRCELQVDALGDTEGRKKDLAAQVVSAEAAKLASDRALHAKEEELAQQVAKVAHLTQELERKSATPTAGATVPQESYDSAKAELDGLRRQMEEMAAAERSNKEECLRLRASMESCGADRALWEAEKRMFEETIRQLRASTPSVLSAPSTPYISEPSTPIYGTSTPAAPVITQVSPPASTAAAPAVKQTVKIHLDKEEEYDEGASRYPAPSRTLTARMLHSLEKIYSRADLLSIVMDCAPEEYEAAAAQGYVTKMDILEIIRDTNRPCLVDMARRKDLCPAVARKYRSRVWESEE